MNAMLEYQRYAQLLGYNGSYTLTTVVISVHDIGLQQRSSVFNSYQFSWSRAKEI